MYKHSARIEHIQPFYVMDLLARAQKLEQSGISIVHMEVGEPDFATPPMIIDAAAQILAAGQLKYTAAAGMLQLRENIAEHYYQQYQLSILPQRIFLTPGASGAFILAMAMLVDPGDEVLMPDPCYPCNRNFIHLFEGKPKLIAVDGASNYQLTADL
ncbi:MAG: aminotransferase class I/II-fold pyridoxal phosphate-dependent enzyme, partial [Methylococcales bacterium]